MSNDESLRKCRKASEACGVTPEIHHPQKNKWDLMKLNKYWRVVKWVKLLGETPVTDFSHLAFACVRESVRTRGYGHEESHLMHDMKYSIYDCIFCMECGLMYVCHYMCI